MIKKLIYALWGMLAVGLIAVFLVFFSINKGWVGFVPPVEELENPNYKFATQIISSDGQLLSTYSYSRENRVWTDYKDLSPESIKIAKKKEADKIAEHLKVT